MVIYLRFSEIALKNARSKDRKNVPPNASNNLLGKVWPPLHSCYI